MFTRFVLNGPPGAATAAYTATAAVSPQGERPMAAGSPGAAGSYSAQAAVGDIAQLSGCAVPYGVYVPRTEDLAIRLMPGVFCANKQTALLAWHIRFNEAVLAATPIDHDLTPAKKIRAARWKQVSAGDRRGWITGPPG